MLTERQLLIFRAIIDHFIETVQPVGSKNLLKENNLSFSSATIRNEMSVLEEYGFIEKTHSSSGRIPSEKGYRFYVDYLLEPQKLKKQDIMSVQSLFSETYFEVEQLIQKSALMLSDLTNYTSILLGPASKQNRLSGFRFVPINRNQAMLILITDQGHIDNHVVTIPETMTPSDMERVVNILNERLVGIPIDQMNAMIPAEVSDLLRSNMVNHELMLSILKDSFQQISKEKVYFGGKTNILNQPEFHDFAKVRELLRLMDQEKDVYQLFSDIPQGLHVKIGTEINNHLMEDCSIITATYSIANEHVGGIVLLGPTRMEYDRMMGLVDLVSRDLTTVLTKLYHDNQK
ncbi:heat-inducible transcriptional repressor HrcA [Paenilisteria rocourtiae]|uniref:Heat-inducible transcription repressor HrcA n=1 Tax=Listeria rocourtiae TaxID=647910 RepID=A0A4R6ZMR0_9LIST|nr:heat-inducible transcriptional repressor HrcA [Listeria rocourtiae]EUJ51595.1 heat-inducible transcription repressor [Listeria rocourtiae FSL F6-920]MBC1434501.1 heat-inducible transcriptional repressor HrcA [Listeria rocourtiae]MBC1603839.1 heat-inducible transcriptional repressor HrcA [Listeria rocourtiae]TDR53655.1 heat-inducible transcription repressor HrcA [Listeria rocourtiae]